MEAEVGKYLTELNQRIRKGCSAHISQEGRLYYMNHETKISSWLPPVESWDSGGTNLPYGWEAAVDKEGKTYYINHVNRTTTYEDPRKDTEEDPPHPREVELIRDPQMGFGFVAGSEKPVIVRFVTEGGPNEHKLLPGDQILKINGEDVMKAPREHVIERVRSCKHSVTLTVCQPLTNNTTRKSALLTAAKKAKLKNNPSRVRFAEGVVINGSPLYSPSPLDSCVPFLPNVLKVFMENGQTKSFKYDSTTTVQDVLNSLQEKLSIKCVDHFSLVTEHVKIARRNRMSILDPKDTLAKIAARPGAHHLRCVFRVMFVPKDAYDLLQKDPVAFEYLYVQCCNDMVQERFAPELKYDIALRLAALHIQQHALSSGTQGKVAIKTVERESGLDRFVPMSLIETMKRKELRKLLSHFLKQNQSLCAPGQKQLTALQAKLHYLKIISELPSYGAKCFSTNLKDSSPETALLISPKFGISQIACLRNTTLPLRCKPQQKHEKQTTFENRVQKAPNLRQQENKNFIMKPITLAQIEEVSDVRVSKEDELSFLVEIFLKDPEKQTLNFSMEDRDAEELVLLLKGYHRLLSGRDLPIQWDVEDAWRTETVPSYHNRHSVQEAPWSYPPCSGGPGIRTLDLAVPPPSYTSFEQQEKQMSRSSSREHFVISSISSPTSVDHNMNETQYLANDNEADSPAVGVASQEQYHEQRISVPSRPIIDERHPGIDYQSVISMELLEDSSGDVDVDLFEAKNDEVIRRISEMNKIVVDAETYLCDDQDTDMYISHHHSTDDSESLDHPPLKAADSLLLLTQQSQNTAITVAQQLEDEPQVILDEEISPSESDTDSTPNDSPLHRSTPIRNSLNSNPRMGRRDSSFGLHSPDLLPGLNPGSSNIIEILKHLQSEEIQLPFAEGTLYLDPDIIDLTMIPPPITPDTAEAREVSTPLNAPPTPFLDNGNLQKEIEKWVKVSERFIRDQELDSEGREMVPDDVINDRSQRHECRTVDTAKVVADLDNLCDALSEMQATSLGQKTYSKVTISSLPSKESIDSFIASVAVPLPPVEGKSSEHETNSDDLSAYIIPPPPCSSPSTEAQNEVIARFMAAAEDMRRMIGNGHSLQSDNPSQTDLMSFYPAQDSSHTLQKLWSSSPSNVVEHSPENISHSPDSHLQETLNILDNFTCDLDSEFQCGDSSGYDTLTSSLTSYCETITSDEIDSSCYNNVESDVCGYGSFPNSTESTPVLEHVPTTLSVFSSTLLNSVPVTPRTKMSCIDATSPLSITSPSSTTSSDSSVILLEPLSADSCDTSDPKQIPPRVKKSKMFSNDSTDTSETLHSGSCDNLPITTHNPPSPDSHPANISRSSSWTSMTEIDCTASEKTLAVNLQKSAGPVQQFHQSCLRRSFNKDSPVSPAVPKKPIPPIPRKSDADEKTSSPLQENPSPEFTDTGTGVYSKRLMIFPSEMQLVKNGITPTPASSKSSSYNEGLPSECLHHDTRSYHKNAERKDIDTLTNGDIISDDASLFSTDPETGKSQEMTCQMLMKALSNDHISISRSGGPFHQAQKDISTMIVHLEKLGHISLKAESSNSVSEDKFNAAKEALVNESRQFVTSSKLFVKSAMESSDKMIENMAVCVALLNRMFTVGELLIMHMCSEESIVFLIERLKDVAIAYLHTVDAAKQAMGTGITNPQMGMLMHQATTLATALTSLMRTLRSISSN